MSPERYRKALDELLSAADVRVEGARPWDFRVHDDRVYQRILGNGSLGAGEAYMEGWWDSPQLDQLIDRVLRASLDRRLRSARVLLAALRARLVNPQSLRRAWVVGERHYDIGDDLYSRMLDSRMIYSCGYWLHATNLEEAQTAKLDLVCRKLGLKPGMRVLDIGCGWGGAARFAAERYGVHVTGVTISRNQAQTARERCAGLNVDIVLDDYRNLSVQAAGRFDRVYSLGMFEHVGVRNYRTYFAKVRELIARDGLFLLHTIGSNESRSVTDPWIEKYIFPNSMLPSMAQITRACEGMWVPEDWHGFGPDYDRTLLAWYENFERAWPDISDKYGERFRRMWHFYLLASAGGFRARKNQLWQFVLSPEGVPGGYIAVR